MPALFAISWDWITQNLEYVIPVLFVVFSFFGRDKSGKASEEETAPPPLAEPSRSEPADGLSDEQRAEQVRAEIRRRIRERMGLPPEEGGAPAPMEPQQPAAPVFTPVEEAPPPLPEPVFTEEPERREFPEAEEERPVDHYGQLEEARRLAAQTAAAASATIASSSRAAFELPGASQARPGGTATRPASLKAELRDRDALRRAIVLREILDQPVSLRR